MAAAERGEEGQSDMESSSSAEDDDSDGDEEGPRGRMCAQS